MKTKAKFKKLKGAKNANLPRSTFEMWSEAIDMLKTTHIVHTVKCPKTD